MANYFSSLPLRLKIEELGKCEFMDQSEFTDGVKKIEREKNCRTWMRSPGPCPGS